jgi:hypothetical protein
MICIESKIYSELSLQFLVICKLTSYVDSQTTNHKRKTGNVRIRLEAIAGKSKYMYDYANPRQNEGQNYYMITDDITKLRSLRTTVIDQNYTRRKLRPF